MLRTNELMPDGRHAKDPPPAKRCSHLSISRKERTLPPVSAAGIGERLISWWECDDCGDVLHGDNPPRFA